MNKTLKSVLVVGILGVGCFALSFLAQEKAVKQLEDAPEGENYIFEEFPAADTSVEILGYDTNGMDYVKEQNVYERGESGSQNGLIYTIEDVSLNSSLEDADGYYQQRGLVQEDVEFRVDWNGYVLYEDELRYLTITVNVENKESEDKAQLKTMLACCNIREDNACLQGASIADWRCWNEDGEEVECKDKISIPAGSTYTIELVMLIYPAEIYDYYLAISSNNGWASWSNIYLNLDLALHETDGFYFITDKEAESTLELRDLANLKVSHITNKEMAESQKEGTLVLERYFHEPSETIGEIAEVDWGDGLGGIEIYCSWLSNVKDVQLKNTIQELPESFQNRTYLQDMTKVYMEKFGYEESELKYLMITIEMEQQMDVEEVLLIDNVAQLMWLYNRDSENRLWRIGYPDDYELQGWDTDGAEHKDHVLVRNKDVYTMTGVYVIWPDALQNVYLWEPGGPACLPEGEKSTYDEVQFNTDATQGGVKIEIPEAGI